MGKRLLVYLKFLLEQVGCFEKFKSQANDGGEREAAKGANYHKNREKRCLPFQDKLNTK